jgi:TonB family protein
LVLAALTAPAVAGAEDASDSLAAMAAAQGAQGLAVINCHVTVERSLDDCKVLRESPPGSGFGTAALEMSSHFRLSPQSTTDAGGRVTLPMLFRSSPGENAGSGADTAPDSPAAPAPAAPAADLPDRVAV